MIPGHPLSLSLPLSSFMSRWPLSLTYSVPSMPPFLLLPTYISSSCNCTPSWVFSLAHQHPTLVTAAVWSYSSPSRVNLVQLPRCSSSLLCSYTSPNILYSFPSRAGVTHLSNTDLGLSPRVSTSHTTLSCSPTVVPL